MSAIAGCTNRWRLIYKKKGWKEEREGERKKERKVIKERERDRERDKIDR